MFQGGDYLNITSPINLNVLGIVVLCFTISLAFRNIVIDKYITKNYIFTSIITIILLILEMLTIFLQDLNNSKFTTMHIILNIIGFSISPLVPYILLLSDKKKIQPHSRILAIPLFLNAIICILSYKTGWIFFFNAQNQYIRGDLFIIPTLVGLLYYTLWIIIILKNNFEYDSGDKLFLNAVFIMPILATSIQLIFNGIILIWGSVSIAMLLYYIFLRELQFKYDALSGIKNRAAFEKEMRRCQKDKNNVAIVVLDLNNLKKINDTLGHGAGDTAIFNSAKLLQQSFEGVGKSYRIGGDEFCVICNNVDKKTLDGALFKLEYLLNKINENASIEIILAHGYSFYIKNQNQSIYDTFINADKSMYVSKAKLKGLYGRRMEDLDAIINS